MLLILTTEEAGRVFIFTFINSDFHLVSFPFYTYTRARVLLRYIRLYKTILRPIVMYGNEDVDG